MHITAKVDYAVRILVEIARAQSQSVKADVIVAAQEIPPKVLESVVAELRKAGLVTSRRGPEGGYRLARPAREISVADVIRAVEGPLASVRGQRPEDVVYPGVAEPLQRVWIALRVNIRSVLERVSIADIGNDLLPTFMDELLRDPDAWTRRPRPLDTAPHGEWRDPEAGPHGEWRDLDRPDI
ncbi:Rrf2 family transcriptional regulator [Nocardia otitidiscaviarum]|uniref:RrF2 family transcriptional regulator n=1 Tax=Nocardia otitidiscaviarum TaxID=1823 RepID=UPI0009DD3A49|nr:Rrf2 family transcriptional regulator [Nocardia otitidiscaviarum]MBF6136093.1 Rrf2 family transcriptional regulator [Nocardia otitidiscaviarum]MBF6483876.1 Rrf2 family transcriptional regulator [Nocardia otitidiscaviarum]